MSGDYLSENLQSVLPSATIAMSRKAKTLLAEGKNVIMLSQGEPDFETPEFIKEAAINALTEGKTRYTLVDGIIELKQSISEKFKHDNRLIYSADQINVSPGGKAVIFNALKATLNPDDEVIIPAPCWVSYPEMTRLCGAVPKIVPTGPETGYKLTPELLEKAITPKTKWLLLNSPSNPTGVCLTREDLRGLGEVLKHYPDILILTDDIYEHLIFDGKTFATIAEVVPELYPRTLTMNGVSKAYAMTGWRIGYAGGPEWLIKAIRKIMGQTTSNASSISQWAARAALSGPQDFLDEWRQAFQSRRDLVHRRLQELGMPSAKPDGAFYVFADCSSVLGRTSPAGRPLDTGVDFTESLLDEALIAVVPGSAFHAPGHFRLSFAAARPELQIAMDRLETFISGCR